MQRRAAGAAGDVEQPNAGAELELRREPLQLGQREPVVLAEVVAELRTAKRGIHLVGELAVVRTVVAADLGLLGHGPSLSGQSRARSQRIRGLARPGRV